MSYRAEGTFHKINKKGEYLSDEKEMEKVKKVLSKILKDFVK